MTMNSAAFGRVYEWIRETGIPYQIIPSSVAALGIERAPWNESCYEAFDKDLAKQAASGRQYPETIDSRCVYGVLNNHVSLFAVKDAHWDEYVTWAATKGYHPVKGESMYLSMSVWGSYMFPPRDKAQADSD